jgi:hypothetical protein
MQRTLYLIAWVVILSLSASTIAVAQDSKPVEVGSFFSWATSNPPAWKTGLFYALLGVVGALVTIYTLVGGAIPGTAGAAGIEAGLRRVEEREKILDELVRGPNRDAGQIKAIEDVTNNLRDDVIADRTRQFKLAGLLYAVLGAFFATLLAENLLQALVIGAGWTAYLGALGLKRDYAERKNTKDEIIERIEGMVSHSLQARNLDDEERKEARELLLEASVAKAL